MQAFPQIIDYNEAVQHPATAFTDPELREARLKENALGLPLVLSGGFALTYMLMGARRTMAVRCFHRHILALEQKYAAISQTFRRLASPYFVGFEFLAEGIRVRGQLYPVLKMDWAEGEVLGLWLDRNHGDAAALARARGAFAALAQDLEEQGISHGDIQNGNVIVSPQGIRLVDYDGVYVPGMPAGEGTESGHRHFQHPDRHAHHHGPGLDRFSFIALDLSLAALIEDPSLFRRYCEGGETILFRANDFADPSQSAVFGILAGMPSLAGAAQRFAQICRGPIEAVPTLQTFLAGQDAPPGRQKAATAPAPARPSARYISTYPVLNAADFAAVMNHIGQRVELVGRIASVEAGVGKGLRHGRPCLEVNFSRHWRNTVGFTIGSDSNEAPPAPVQDWVGRWVSAVGLIGQPFVTDAFLVPRTRVGIVLDDPSQMNFISAEQAEYRLVQPAGGSRLPEVPVVLHPPGGNRSPALGNRQMVAQMLNRMPSAPAPAAAVKKAAPAPRPKPPANANGGLVGRLRSMPPPTPPVASLRVPPAPPAPIRRRIGRSPVMVLHPRPPGIASNTPSPTPSPPTWMEVVLRKLGLRD